jgi:hypothetical protein
METEAILDRLASEPPTVTSAARLEELRRELESLIQDNLGQVRTFVRYMSRVQEESRRAAMAENRSRPERNRAEVQQLSDQLSTELRLERVDGAIKELLGFLADAPFFTANASTGRRRRLRTLQKAIEDALQK